MWKFFEFSKKNGIYVKDPCQVYLCTKFQVYRVSHKFVLTYFSYFNDLWVYGEVKL